MARFTHTTAKIAAWNLAGYGGIPDERIEQLVNGLAILDAEAVTLVEVTPFAAMEKIKAGLAARGCAYDSVMLPQHSDLNIGVIFKQGIEAGVPEFVPGSDLGNEDFRRALVVDMKIGRFDFKLIAVHLKSGRGRREQEIRDAQAKVIGS